MQWTHFAHIQCLSVPFIINGSSNKFTSNTNISFSFFGQKVWNTFNDRKHVSSIKYYLFITLFLYFVHRFAINCEEKRNSYQKHNILGNEPNIQLLYENGVQIKNIILIKDTNKILQQIQWNHSRFKSSIRWEQK